MPKKLINEGKRGGTKKHALNQGINNTNLKFISPVFSDTKQSPVNNKTVNLGLVNAHSVNLKECYILDTSVEENLDIVIITETWILSTDNDRARTEASTLNGSGYKLYNIGRNGPTKGGGVGVMLFKDSVKLTGTVTGDIKVTFEYIHIK